MNEIAHVSAHIMDISKLKNWHHMTKTFKALPNIKKKFCISIIISKVQNGLIHVWVKESLQRNEAQYFLRKPGGALPELDNDEIIPYLNVPILTMARRKDLKKTVYTYLEKSERLRLNQTTFWEDIIGQGVLHNNENNAEVMPLPPISIPENCAVNLNPSSQCFDIVKAVSSTHRRETPQHNFNKRRRTEQNP